MAIDPTDITLTPQQRQSLAKLAQQTGRSHSELIDEWLATLSLESQFSADAEPERSLFDVLTERGMLGCFDGPTDLATNPKHMEGFGRDAQSNSD